MLLVLVENGYGFYLAPTAAAPGPVTRAIINHRARSQLKIQMISFSDHVISHSIGSRSIGLTICYSLFPEAVPETS